MKRVENAVEVIFSKMLREDREEIMSNIRKVASEYDDILID